MDLKEGCVICGEYVPEGTWVCPSCLRNDGPAMYRKSQRQSRKVPSLLDVFRRRQALRAMRELTSH